MNRQIRPWNIEIVILSLLIFGIGWSVRETVAQRQILQARVARVQDLEARVERLERRLDQREARTK
jgi:hypothetical protein